MTRRALGLTGGLALALLMAGPALAQQMVDIPAGTFRMGAKPDASRDWFNERPAHQVTISKSFKIAATEVTIAEWKQFRPNTPITTTQAPYVAGISWNDATAYAAWLSKRTGRHYRLPTEAEWEYVARLTEQDPQRYAAIKGIESGPKEWTADRFGPYDIAAQTDPTGAASGPLRVVRGGRIGFNPSRAKTDPEVEIDYSRPEARLAFPPTLAPYPGAEAGGGFHSIGLRLVEGPAPATAPAPVTPPMHEVGVRQDLSTATLGPDPSKPYFRRRVHLPTPPDDSKPEQIDPAGFDSYFRFHHHSPAITVMPNGDVLIVEYSTYREYEAGGTMIATRLRHGADEWDPPELFVDTVGVNDHASLLMADGKTTRFFWGSPYMEGQEFGPGGFPFQFMTSTDNGASWSDITYPKITTKVGPHNRQPINTAFRDSKGRLLLASDAGTQESITESSDNQALLWASPDNGKTWQDTGGRSFGRHTTFVEAKDGRILGFGGKNTDIDGFMPLSTSTDGGKTYTKSKTPFTALGSGQRPMVLRLHSGRLLMLGDYVRAKPVVKPTDKRGSYAAVSDDDGKTWRFKSLPGALPYQGAERAKQMEGSTVGYVAAAQGPDGIIHVVTSQTRPSITLSFNEAWLDAPDAPLTDAALDDNDVTSVSDVKVHEEKGANGKLRGRWSGGRGNTGAIVFDGPQTWYHPNGKVAWEVTYRLGQKTGLETMFDVEGRRLWTRDLKADGTTVWTRWWSNGQMRSQSSWRGEFAEGPAKTWDETGHPVSNVLFVKGEIAP